MRIRRLFVLPSLMLVLGTMLALTPAPAAAAAAGGVSASATPDFQMTVEGDPGTNPPFRHVKRGSGAPYFVTITSLNGFTGSVTLSLTGNIPANSTVRITNPTGFGPLNSGGVTIQTHKVITPTGTFDMTIHGTSGSLEHDQPIILTVG
jgi:serine protease AprX